MRKQLTAFLSAPGALYNAIESRAYKLKRDILRDRVISNGERLDRFYRARNGVDASVWPDDCAHLDGIITNLERKRDRLLQQMREG